MKITVDLQEDREVKSISYVLCDDIDIYDLLDVFKKIAIGMTYTVDTWNDAIISQADAIESEQYLDQKDKVQ